MKLIDFSSYYSEKLTYANYNNNLYDEQQIPLIQVVLDWCIENVFATKQKEIIKMLLKYPELKQCDISQMLGIDNASMSHQIQSAVSHLYNWYEISRVMLKEITADKQHINVSQLEIILKMRRTKKFSTSQKKFLLFLIQFVKECDTSDFIKCHINDIPAVEVAKRRGVVPSSVSTRKRAAEKRLFKLLQLYKYLYNIYNIYGSVQK